MKPIKKIILVDDDADDREFIREAFIEAKPENTEIEVYQNGETLLEALKSSPREEFPSLILLDLNMPGKDGKTILTEIKSSDALSHIPVVILTTSSSEKERDRCYDVGANCFVTKPSKFSRMVDLVRSLVSLWVPNRNYF